MKLSKFLLTSLLMTNMAIASSHITELDVVIISNSRFSNSNIVNSIENFEPISGKYYKIKNRLNGNLLCAWNADANRKGTAGMWQDNVDTSNVHWCFIKKDDYYKIKNKTAGNLLCAWNSETDRGSAGMWQDNVDISNLHWSFKKEEGYYKIKSRNGSNNVLSSWGNETNTCGSVAMAADVNGNTLEHWYFISVE